jgi:class 3 adenylate cyclase
MSKSMVQTRDELAVLADSFNHMVLGLREKERIKTTFGQYVDPRIVRGLLDNRLAAEGGQRQVMTVFFSDLANFTQMCEGLTPDTAVRFLNRYFSLMSDIVRARQGIVDKYIGDSVMAFWGPPFSDETGHAELCCAAALEQMAQLEAFRADLPNLIGVRYGLPQVDIRIGIASGEVTVGNIGSDTSRGYTVIGDTVNLASRLEQANKFYGTRILVSAETRRLAGETLAFREIDSLRVAGKQEPIRVHELLGLKADLTPNCKPASKPSKPAWAITANSNGTPPKPQFNACLLHVPQDRPSQVFIERIKLFRATPLSPDWDGVWVATSK